MPITDIINSIYNHKPVTGIFSIALLIIGFTLNYFGIKLFRFVIAITAFLISSLSAYIFLTNVHLHAYNFGVYFDRVIGVGMLVAGIVGALLSGWMWKWILLGVGAFGGVSFTLVVLSSLNSISFPIWIRPVLIGVSAILGAFLLHKFERPLIIFATSITGAFLFSFGLDVFIETGFDILILTILTGSVDPTKIVIKDRQVYGMILLWCGSTLLGIVIQSKFIGKNIQSVTKQ